MPSAPAGVAVKSPSCDQKLHATPRFGICVGDGPAFPPSRVFPRSPPYWRHSPAPSFCWSAGGKMSAGSGFESLGIWAPLPALGTPGLPPAAPTVKAPCIHTCKLQWNLYVPGSRNSTPLTGDESPPPVSALANFPSSETRSCLAVLSRLL